MSYVVRIRMASGRTRYSKYPRLFILINYFLLFNPNGGAALTVRIGDWPAGTPALRNAGLTAARRVHARRLASVVET